MSNKIIEHPQIEGVTLFSAPTDYHVHEDHAHDGYSIIVVTQGAKLFRYKGEKVKVSRHEIAISNPYDLHGCGPFEETAWAHKTWYVSQDLAKELVGGAPEIPILQTPVIRDSAIAQQLIAAHDVAMSGGESLDREEAALTALSALFTQYSDNQSAEEISPKTDAPSTRIKDYIALMDDFLDEGVELQALADKGGVSRNHVIRDFRHVLGTTPGAYFRHLRLGRGKEIIVGGASLADAAAASGFSDQSHFTRQFRKAYGITPNEYRKLAQKGAAQPL